MMQRTLRRQLSEKRKKLYSAIVKNGDNLTCKEVVEASKELDTVIVLIQEDTKITDNEI
jgi:hypothetical protein